MPRRVLQGRAALSLSAAILVRLPASATRPGTALGRLLRMSGPRRSSELERILALPRRDWRTEDYGTIEDSLRLPGGTQRLRPIQASALAEIGEQGGLLGPIAVGEGKTLISILAASVLGAAHPVLLVKSELRGQTEAAIEEARRHWRVNPALRVVGHSELSVVSGADLLERLDPDLIVIDEAQAFRRASSARTRRLRRHMAEHPGCRLVAISGTLMRRSLRDWHGLACWALRGGAPVPLLWREAEEWALALDEPEEGARPGPAGALTLFLDKGEAAPEFSVEALREAFGRRVRETPGVVASDPRMLGVALTIRILRPALDPSEERALRTLRNAWETPDGDPVMTGAELWAHARQIVLSHFLRWDPPAPAAWLEARRAWRSWARQAIKGSRGAIDSELQAARRAEAERLPEWLAWRDIRETFLPNSVPVWLSRRAIEAGAAWLRDNPKGILWADHVAYGQEVAKAADVPYLGSGREAGERIMDVTGPIVASSHAHREGRNLQRYETCLVTAPSPDPTWHEQLIGRLHRSGQKADEVRVDMWASGEEADAAIEAAVAKALWLRQMDGQDRRLLYADWIEGEAVA